MSADIQVFLMCTSNEAWSAEVAGSKGDRYTVSFGELSWTEKNRQGCDYGWSCTCRAFQYRGTCKHIARAKPFRCGYHEQWGTGTPAPEEDPSIKVLTKSTPSSLGACPCCGGSVVAVRCAV